MATRDGVFKRSDRKGFWISYVDAAGLRRKEKVQAHTQQQAQTILAAKKTAVEREKVLGVREVTDLSTADLLDRFRRYQRPHLKPSSYQRCEAVTAMLAKRLPAMLKDVSRATVAKFVAERSEEVAAGTVQKEVVVLKHALRMAVEWDLLTANPADRTRLPKTTESRTRYLSPTELKAAIVAAPDWLRAPLALAAFTGMRRGEILGLRWTDVDLAGRRVYLHDTKNGSLRVVPLNELALSVLQGLPVSGKSVFSGFTPQNVSVATRRLFADLGIEDASFHSLRHTAASWLVMQGVDLYVVGQVLGHKTPRMTQRYSHLSPTYVANAISKLDSAFSSVLESGDAVGTKEAGLTAEGSVPPRKTASTERVMNTGLPRKSVAFSVA